MGHAIKDIDIVVDSLALDGKDSAWFAKEVQKGIPARTNLTTNQYGVAILSVSEPWTLDGYDMRRETIEMANARKESYGGDTGKGYKPHMVAPATIEEDLRRREFTFNTLLWRLHDLGDGPDKAEVIDLTGVGLRHLRERVLDTPSSPDVTFSDDPTRMLRAVKFAAKYGFTIPTTISKCIHDNAPKLKLVPWDAVRKILVEDVLRGPTPRRSVELMESLSLAQVIREMLREVDGFATAVSRGLLDVDIHLVLDLLDMGWVFRTSIYFLDRNGQVRLRQILLDGADDPDFEKRFVGQLCKPPIDQERLFALFSIPPKDRGTVVRLARAELLRDPKLSENAEALENAVERRLTPPF
jgi:tRNA nucleotidyltransferase/poly(A) polymerase